MVSAALVKLSSPVARSFLIALGIGLVIDAVLTFFAASQYPYLIPYTNELHIPGSIPLIYCAIGAAAVLLAVSTALASYKSSTNYVLVHACITGVFLPFAILVYFSSLSARYKVGDYADDYKQMIIDYRVTSHQIKLDKHETNSGRHSTTSALSGSTTTVPTPPLSSSSSSSSAAAAAAAATTTTTAEPVKQLKLISFINLIDSIQSRFSCCGVESLQDWAQIWDEFVPPSCCNHAHTTSNAKWSRLFKMDEAHEFQHCPQAEAHHMGCLAALKEDEQGKFGWLSNLIVFLMVMTITNTIFTLLLYGLSKTENMPYDDTNENELAMVGVSMKPRPSQPEITGIRHRPSVVQTLGAPSKEQIASISHAVRFNLANSPRGSVSGPSKFSAGARRGSAFV